MLRRIYRFALIVAIAAVVFTALVPQAVLAEGTITSGPATSAVASPVSVAVANYVPKGTWVWYSVRFWEAVAAETWTLSGARTAGRGEWSYTGKIYQNCQWRTWSVRQGYQWHMATGYEVAKGRYLRVTLRKP